MEREAAVGAVPSFLLIGEPCCTPALALLHGTWATPASFLKTQLLPPPAADNPRPPNLDPCPPGGLEESAEGVSLVKRAFQSAHAPSCW